MPFWLWLPLQRWNTNTWGNPSHFSPKHGGQSCLQPTGKQRLAYSLEELQMQLVCFWSTGEDVPRVMWHGASWFPSVMRSAPRFWRCWGRGLHGMARRKEKGCWRTTSQKWAWIPKVTPAWQPWTLHLVKKKVKMRVMRKAAAVTWKGYLLAWRRIGKLWQWKSLLLPLGMSHLRALWRHLRACEEAFCIQAQSWLED